ncbi:hypothetical protein [Rothia nasimurium]|uniref:hypothetical protein n=1 Tax=Rothia nasimurium TaxID=85336 RepID=UPI001F3A1A3B|nr:hypothetical protein [Rothia nasimurium]
MSKLSEHLNNLNRGELSTRQISNMAAKQGVSASHVTLSRYLRGDHPIPAKRAPLEAFAIAFGVSVEPLIELGNQSEEGYPFELPAKAATLNEAERAAILHLIDVMVASKLPTSLPGTVAHQVEEIRREQELERLANKFGDFHPERAGYDLAAHHDDEARARMDWLDNLGEEPQD